MTAVTIAGEADTGTAQEQSRPNAGSPGLGMPFVKHSYDYLIVGAGFAGSVLAERLASQAGKTVFVVERRDHIGGNAYDHFDDSGILIHKYGPHIFHTNSERVFRYLSQFTEWRLYEHRVRAAVRGQLLPLPINRTTVNALYGLDLRTDEQCADFFRSVAEPVKHPRTAEDAVVAKVGRDLYETFFRGYTRRHWGLNPSELDASVTARIPVRTNTDDRYFGDTYQAMPRHGYTRLFQRMLSHPYIHVLLGADYREVAGLISHKELIYTGPIDEYFDHRFGRLPYLTLEFRHETHEQEWFQDVPVVNFPDERVPYDRVTEFKYLTGQRHRKTSVVYEYPRPHAEGDPYYPVPRPENAALFRRYWELADHTPGVRFVGRLATYRYYNMDQVVAQALTVFEELLGRRPASAANVPAAASAAGTPPGLPGRRALGRAGHD